jgi:hypothetical protein
MLVLHDVYRMATIAEGEAALVTGKESDDFLMEANDPFDGLGRIPTSTRSIQNGDALPLDRWPGLTEWHAGLSCLTQLYPNHGIAMVRQGQCDADFLADFNRPRQQNSTIDGRKYRVMRVYRLARGTMIPTGIGIERDGDGRASLFPITEPATVSKVAGGHEAFTVDALVPLQPYWTPFAIFHVLSEGYDWPDVLPPDSALFPLRRWVRAVIREGDADIAYTCSAAAHSFTEGRLPLDRFLHAMSWTADKFFSDCPIESIELNRTAGRAFRFALRFLDIIAKKR